MIRRVLAALALFILLYGCHAGIKVAKSIISSASFNHHMIFTFEDFPQRLSGLPAAALADPEGFLALAETMIHLPDEQILLIDKNHLLPEDYVPENLVSIDSIEGVFPGRAGLLLGKNAAEALGAMSRAASEDGITLIVSSAYRSFEYQRRLFERYSVIDGKDRSSRYIARPGASQHQLGTTVDIGDITTQFADEPDRTWMMENAGEFGWSQSYPFGMEEFTGYQWESWHWRWIGKEALRMQNEYFDGVQQRMLEFWNENASTFREAWID